MKKKANKYKLKLKQNVFLNKQNVLKEFNKAGTLLCNNVHWQLFSSDVKAAE